MKTFRIRKFIKPFGGFLQGDFYEIVSFSDEYYIKEIRIKTDNYYKIKNVFLKERHPNADPKTKEYCTPKKFIDIELKRLILEALYNELSIYRLDDCFFIPKEKDIRFNKPLKKIITL